MSDHRDHTGQNYETEHEDQWAMHAYDISQRFDYPPTPDIAGAIRARFDRRAARRMMPRNRLAYRPARAVAGAILLLIVLGLITVLAVPDLRAKAFDWLRIGSVRIVREDVDTPPEIALDDPLFDPAYAVTLDDARARVEFPVPIPAGLGAPDRVFFHALRDPVVILVWTDPAALPDSVTPPLSLHLIGAANVVTKYSSEEEIQTHVGDQPAVWLANPHMFAFRAGDGDMVQRFVTGGVLIWESPDPAHTITYRLEGDLALDEARRLAESLP